MEIKEHQEKNPQLRFLTPESTPAAGGKSLLEGNPWES